MTHDIGVFGAQQFTNPPWPEVTGGSLVLVSDGYKYHVFNSTGVLNVVNNAAGPVFDLLVIGGGGGSWASAPGFAAGGGGAGGAVEVVGMDIPTGSYTMTVGGGGGNVTNGTSSTAFTGNTLGIRIAALGGGSAGYPGGPPAGNGGCGGASNSPGPAVGLGLQPSYPNTTGTNYGGPGAPGWDASSGEGGGIGPLPVGQYTAGGGRFFERFQVGGVNGRGVYGEADWNSATSINSIFFEGSGSYVQAGSAEVLKLATKSVDYTLETWVRFGELRPKNIVFGTSVDNGTCLYLTTTSDTTTNAVLYDSDRKLNITWKLPFGLNNTGTWYHVALSNVYYKGAMSVYVNGNRYTTATNYAFDATAPNTAMSAHFSRSALPLGGGGANYTSMYDRSRKMMRLGTYDFTAEAWVKYDGGGNLPMIFYDYSGVMYVRADATTRRFNYRCGAASQTETTATLVTGAWHHIALVRQGLTNKLFKDGREIARNTETSIYYLSGAVTQTFGGTPDGNSNSWSGNIYGARITRGQALYTGTFEPSAIISNTETARTGVLALGGLSTPNKSIWFNHDTTNTEYLSVTNAVQMTRVDTPITPSITGNWTVETWVNLARLTQAGSRSWDSTATGVAGVIAGTGATTSTGWTMSAVGTVNTYTGFQFKINGTTSTQVIAAYTGSVNICTWYHVAAVKNASVLTLYVNGIARSTATVPQFTAIDELNTTGTGLLTIGKDSVAAWPAPLNGSVSNFRITNNIAVYTGNFTPPTTSAATTQTAGTNIAAITTATIPVNGFSVITTGSNELTLTGPGVNDELFIRNRDFTVEGWFFLRRVGVDGAKLFLIGYPTGWTGYSPLETTVTPLGAIQVTMVTFLGSGNGTTPTLDVSTANGVFTFNTWHHVAVVRRYGTFSEYGGLYLDGIKQTVTVAVDILTASSNMVDVSGSGVPLLVLGDRASSQSELIVMGISNFRFTNYNAVYSNNFTPPTLPFTTSTAVAAETFRTGDPGPLGNSMYFNGSIDHVRIADDPLIQLDTVDFTIEGWFNVRAFDSGHINHLFYKGAEWSLVLADYTTEGYGIRFSAGGNILYYSNPIIRGKWYHVAVVRIGTTTSIYVDGVLGASATMADVTPTSTVLLIGNNSTTASTLAHNGYISNIRMVKGVGVYTGAFVPQVGPLSITQSSTFNTVALSGTETSFLMMQNVILGNSSTYALTITSIDNPVIEKFANPWYGVPVVIGAQTGVTATDAQLYFSNSTVSKFTATSTSTLNISVSRLSPFAYENPVTRLIASWSTSTDDSSSGTSLLSVATTMTSVDNSFGPFGYLPQVLAMSNAGLYEDASPNNLPLWWGVGNQADLQAEYLAVSSQVPYGPQSTYFDGTTFISTTGTTSAATVMGVPNLSNTSSFTIEAWIYPTARSGSGGQPSLLGDMQAYGATDNWSIGVMADGRFSFYWYSGGTYWSYSTSIVPLQAWTHVAVSVNVGAISLFINGVRETVTGTTAINGAIGTVGYLTIGRWRNAGIADGYFGYLYALRITQAALYSGNFTPSVNQLTTSTGGSIVGLLAFQEATIRDRSMYNNFTSNGVDLYYLNSMLTRAFVPTIDNLASTSPKLTLGADGASYPSTGTVFLKGWLHGVRAIHGQNTYQAGLATAQVVTYTTPTTPMYTTATAFNPPGNTATILFIGTSTTISNLAALPAVAVGAQISTLNPFQRKGWYGSGGPGVYFLAQYYNKQGTLGGSAGWSPAGDAVKPNTGAGGGAGAGVTYTGASGVIIVRYPYSNL